MMRQVFALKKEWTRMEGMMLRVVRKIPARATPKKVRGMRVGVCRWTAPKARAEIHWAWARGRR